MAVQTDPMTFFDLLRWVDGRTLLSVMELYRQAILRQGLYTFRPDGSPVYRRVLTGRGKKNAKTLDAVLASLFKLLAWVAAGHKGNQVYFVASDLGQANDDLDLCKKLIRCNPVLEEEVIIKQNVIERKDGTGFIEILPAQDVSGLHGKTYLFLAFDELHTQKDYRVLEALEIDRTRPDSTQWFASYASLSRHRGVPLVDLLKQHEAQSDPRLYVSWYSGTVEEANPSMNQPLGPTTEDIEDARRSLPSWIFRRLYLNLPGQPDSAAFEASTVEFAIVSGRSVVPPTTVAGRYHAFVDMSGGGQDNSTLAIAHAGPEGKAILDLVVDEGPRGQTFSPQQAVARFATICKEYRCHSVTGDRYAGEWPRREFQAQGLRYDLSPLTRSELYAALEPLLNSGQVELLDVPILLQQLIGLVRSSGSGKVKIDHSIGEHDDFSNAVAGAIHLVTGGAKVPGIYILNAPQFGDEHLFQRIG